MRLLEPTTRTKYTNQAYLDQTKIDHIVVNPPKGRSFDFLLAEIALNGFIGAILA